MPTYDNLPKTSEFFKGKWYDKMVEDLQLAGMAKRTVYGYVRSIRKLPDFHQKPPVKITEMTSVPTSCTKIVDLELASGSQSVLLSGIKFFFRTTCPRRWKVLDQTKINYISALPEVITKNQVFQMLDACRTNRMKSFIWVTYTLGLRIGEAVNLQVGYEAIFAAGSEAIRSLLKTPKNLGSDKVGTVRLSDRDLRQSNRVG